MYHGVSKEKKPQTKTASGDTASAIGDNDNIPLLRSIQFIQIDILHRRLQGGGHAPPQRPDKNDKNGPICSIMHYQKNIFPGGMPPDPHNSLICSVFLALAAAGPRQCEHLEPPVHHINQEQSSDVSVNPE